VEFKLGPLGTSATEWPIVPAQGNSDDGEIGGMKIGNGNRSTRRKPASAPRCPPQILLDQPRARTRAAAVGSNRLRYGAANKFISVSTGDSSLDQIHHVYVKLCRNIPFCGKLSILYFYPQRATCPSSDSVADINLISSYESDLSNRVRRERLWKWPLLTTTQIRSVSSGMWRRVVCSPFSKSENNPSKQVERAPNSTA
jgi:hypothetical protein